MKKAYAAPDFSVEAFVTEDILTVSIRALPDDTAGWMEI